jgi:hypothetical protein
MWDYMDIMDVARNDILIPTFGMNVASKHDPYHLTGSREWHGNCRCPHYVTDWARAHNVIKHA